MMYVYNKDTVDFSKSGKYIIETAMDVKITQEINGEYILNFSLKLNDISLKFLNLFDILKCDGQLYIFRGVEKNKSNNPIVSIKALHVVSELSNIHIPYYPEQIGVSVNNMISLAIQNSKFSYLTAEEASNLGLTLVTDETDLLGTYDKVSAIEIIKKIIEQIQRGELYVNNYKIGLVEQIGKNQGVILETTYNLTNISRFDDTSELINKLYYYGTGDISTKTGYLESTESQNLYGVRQGFVNFNDVEDLDELQRKASWLVSEDNPHRIDMPQTTIQCGVINLNKLGMQRDIKLGDTVRIFDKELNINQMLRCVKKEYYPFQSTVDNVIFGEAPLTYNQLLTKLELNKENINKYSNNDGKIQATGLDMLAPSISAANNKVWNSSFEIYNEYVGCKYWIGGHVTNLQARFGTSSMLLVASEQTSQDIIAKINVADFVISSTILLAFYSKGGKVRLEAIDDNNVIIPLWSPKTGGQDLYVESNYNEDWKASYTFGLLDINTLNELGITSFRLRLTNVDSVSAWVDGVICQSKYINNYVLYYDGQRSAANEWGDEIGGITAMVPVEVNQDPESKQINGKTEICRLMIESTEQTDALIAVSTEIENTSPQIYKLSVEDNAIEIFYHRQKIDEIGHYSVTKKANGLGANPGTHIFQFFIDGASGMVNRGNITMVLKGIKSVTIAKNPVLGLIETIVGQYGLKEEDYPVFGYYKTLMDEVEVINILAP